VWSFVIVISGCYNILCLLLVNLLLLASLEERSTYRVWGCFLGVENRDDFKKEVLVDEATRDEFALFWEATAGPEIEAFSCFQDWDLKASFFAYLI